MARATVRSEGQQIFMGPDPIRRDQRSKILPIEDARILILGSVNPDYVNVLSTEVYDAGRNVFSVLGGQHPDMEDYSVFAFSDESILIAGGFSFSLPYNRRRAILFRP